MNVTLRAIYFTSIMILLTNHSGNGVAASLHRDVVAIEKGAFGSPSTKVANFTTYLFNHYSYYKYYYH